MWWQPGRGDSRTPAGVVLLVAILVVSSIAPFVGVVAATEDYPVNVHRNTEIIVDASAQRGEPSVIADGQTGPTWTSLEDPDVLTVTFDLSERVVVHKDFLHLGGENRYGKVIDERNVSLYRLYAKDGKDDSWHMVKEFEGSITADETPEVRHNFTEDPFTATKVQLRIVERTPPGDCFGCDVTISEYQLIGHTVSEDFVLENQDTTERPTTEAPTTDEPDGGGGGGGATSDTETGTARTTTAATAASISAPDQRVLLDTSRERLGRLTVDGTPYVVYRYENVLPYASGVEVWGPNGRVESTAKARQVLRVLAWQHSVSHLSAGDIETLRDIQSASRQIESAVTPPLRALDRILQLRSQLQSVDVGFTTINVWQPLVSQYPQVSTFMDTAEALRNRLQDWKSASQRTNENLDTVIRSLERMESGEEVDYAKLGEQFAAAMQGLDQLSRESESLANQLSTAADTSRQIATEVSGLTVSGVQVGDQIARPFESTASTLSRSASQIESFSQTLDRERSKLGSVKQSAEQRQDQYMSGYSTRQQAPMRVYGTIGAAAVLVLLVLRLLFRGGSGGGGGGGADVDSLEDIKAK
ncbi:MAG: hypothetical protein ABEJ55_04215 [Halanaeroarchaeum sp.]